MRLTRRDAVLSLLIGSSVSAAGTYGFTTGSTEQTGKANVDIETASQTLAAVAEVVYPSAVSEPGTFVEEYFSGLPDKRQTIVGETANELDRYARRTRGISFANLSVKNRDSVLRSMGVDRLNSSPDGTLPERIRYYVVNQLLYALYTSPKGGTLLGIQNPVGYPGGYESYQKPPSTSEQASTAGNSAGESNG